MSPQSVSNMTIPDIDESDFKSLALSRLSQNAPLLDAQQQTSGDDDLNSGSTRIAARLTPAAVLVPIIAGTQLTVLLTERMEHLSAHAGQIAFPGGKVDAGDADPLATALREAREEIALDSAFVEPLGYLEPYRTGTGFIITPAVALVRPGFTVAADPAEVADVFEVPLAFLMNEANHRIDSRVWRGTERRFYAMPYGERYIWGATAGIIRSLCRRLFTR